MHCGSQPCHWALPWENGPVSLGGRYGALIRIVGLFARVGLVAFGGPAAHVALLESEFVSRRRWIPRQRFLDLMGATNLIPGPNSTEMTMHLGYERGGAPGMFAAGLGFIGPAACITAVLAWVYLRLGELPAAEPILAGVRPAVLVVILGAVWRLGRKAVRGWPLAAIACCVAAAVWLGAGEVTAILAGGLLGALGLSLPSLWHRVTGLLAGLVVLASKALGAAEPVELSKLGLFFLKVGAVLYGSGYVLVAFLEGGLVNDYGWVTRQQLLDAIAVGQFTPGPVLTAATFLGYLVAGVPGAAVATVGIFLPAFGFVWLLNPLVRRLRETRFTAAFLDAIGASAVGLMAVVALDLATATFVSWPACAIAAGACAALFWRGRSAMEVVLGGGICGWLAGLAGWL